MLLWIKRTTGRNEFLRVAKEWRIILHMIEERHGDKHGQLYFL